MTQALKKMRDTSSAVKLASTPVKLAQEIELIQARLAVLSELESTLERDDATLRAQRAAILLHGFGDGSRQSKIGPASCRPSAVPLRTKAAYRGLTKFPRVSRVLVFGMDRRDGRRTRPLLYPASAHETK